MDLLVRIYNNTAFRSGQFRWPAIILLSILFFFQSPVFAQPKIIFDTDFGADADDLGALVMLHNFIDKSACDLLAVICCNPERYAVSAIDAVNRFYQHPDVPLASIKGPAEYLSWNYSKVISDHFEHKKSLDDVPQATVLYRQILARSSEKSITIVTVGPLINIQNLLLSEADSISLLTGKALVEKKVKEFVIMGGRFPNGENEWNFDGNRPGVTQYVLQNLEVPVTFTGYEVGAEIKTGKVLNDSDKHQPLYYGFMHFSKNAPWIRDRFKGEVLDNASYDQTAVLYAVQDGSGTYWQKINDGHCIADSAGGNRWQKSDQPGRHSYLKLIRDGKELAVIIEAIMLNKF